MNSNELLEERFEDFEGELRKLDELIGQLELWSDEYTINHKKEEVRLVQYVELHLNLESLKADLASFIEEYATNDEVSERIKAYQKAIKEKLAAYSVTEDTIHDWIRDIKASHLIIAKEPVLEANRSFIEAILNA